MRKLLHKLTNNKSAIVIVAIVFLLAITNYVPNTFLTGWDNLQTDLAPWLGVKRAFWAVWEEYQSFGLTSGMAHAADLPRALCIWLLSFVLPQHLLRYVFQFIMIGLGGLGMLRLLTFTGFNKDKKIVALAGSLFYLFTFSTVQMLFLPYDPFTVFFGFLPWEIWIFLLLLTHRPRELRQWVLFIVINILAVSQTVPQQIFVVYMAAIGLLTLGVLIQKRSVFVIKQATLLVAIILFLNSFWLLPQVYFLATSGNVVKEAKANQLNTEDVWYSNKDRGNLTDFVLFNGLFYDRLDKNQQPLFLEWSKHRESAFVLPMLLVLGGICLLGLFANTPFGLPFGLVYALVALMLLSNTPPFLQLNDLLRQNDFINQIFRSPFTKFAILYSLVASYFFASGLLQLQKLISRVKTVHAPLIGSVAIALILLCAKPAFLGQYISPAMKVTIPQEYFSVMDYFSHIDKNKRIAMLPEYTFWGWFYTNWGYNGSGFLWYGIEQPIESRTFDVWSNHSESFYWEIKTALEAEDTRMLNSVLEKYAIDYLFIDKSLQPVVSSTKSMQFDRIETLLKNSNAVTLEKQFNTLSLYRVNHQQKIDNFVWASDSLPNIGPTVTVTTDDTAYQTYGNYITTQTQPYNSYFPFLDLTTQTQLSNAEWQLKESYSDWYITRNLSLDKNLFQPIAQASSEATLLENGAPVKTVLPITTTFNNDTLLIQFPKQVVRNYDLLTSSVDNCGLTSGFVSSQKENRTLLVTSQKGATACMSYYDSHLDQQYGYIVKIGNENKTGRRLFISIVDATKDQAYIEDRLQKDTQYFILGSRYQYGAGYTIGLRNESYKTISSTNTLMSLSTYLLPYKELKNMQLKSIIPQQPTQALNRFTAEKLSYYLYTVSLYSGQNTTVALAQSYDPGWKAYDVGNSTWTVAGKLKQLFPFLFGTELKNHVMVNNWENGWILSNYSPSAINHTLIIVYLPQYLEYAGFLFAVITIFLIIRSKKG
jgi:hypothetical protein